MEKQFERFKAWLAENYKDGLDDLCDPASDAEIKQLEDCLGFPLPADLVSLLKIHNGQKLETGGLFEGQEFLSSHRIIDEWTVWKELLDGDELEDTTSEPEDGIKDDWWNPKWIPFTYNGYGDHYCIDMDPAVGGDEGQIITLWHDGPEREKLAKSLGEWFATYVSELASGEYIYSEDYDTIMHRDDI